MKIIIKLVFLIVCAVCGSYSTAMELTQAQLWDKEQAKSFWNNMNDDQRICSISFDHRKNIVWETKKKVSDEQSFSSDFEKTIYKQTISKAGMPFFLNEIKTNINVSVPLYNQYVDQIDVMLLKLNHS